MLRIWIVMWIALIVGFNSVQAYSLMGDKPSWIFDDSTVIRSIKDGQWSSPDTWAGGVVPTSSHRVFIQHSVVVDNAESGEVHILDGTLTLSGDFHVHGSVVVYGKLGGAQGRLFFHVPNDRLFKGNTEPGPDPDNPDFHPSDIGLWGMPGSFIEFTGTPMTPYLNAIPMDGPHASLKYGGISLPTITENQARLAAVPQNWRVGDTLLLMSVAGDYALAELTQLSDELIMFTRRDSSEEFRASSVQVHGRIVTPKIANLSRRLAIISANVREGDTSHRAHIAILHGGSALLQNIELRNLGPRGKLGRYPIHFHHTGLIGGRVENTTIWQDVNDPGNRLIAVHNTQNVILKDNVGLLSQGHGIFFETGEEINNTISGNLTVDVRGPEELSNVEIAQFPQTYHYWIRSRNTLEKNVAVGVNANSSHIRGLQVIEARSRALKPVTSGVGFIILAHRLRTELQLPSVVNDFEMLGTGLYGYHVGVAGTHIRNSTVAFALQSGNSPSTLDDVIIENPFFIYNGEGELTYPSQLYLSSNKNVTVSGGVFAGKVGIHMHYLSSVVLEGTAVYAQFLLAPTYWNLNMHLSNCDMHIETFFQGAYPRNRNTPGLLRVEGCTGTIKGKVYTPETRFSADFTGDGALPSPLLVGAEEPFRGKRLTAPVPPSGFLRMGAFPRTAVYSVTSPGKAFTLGQLVAESEERWQSLASAGGYPDGFPPGMYHVKTLFPDGRVTGYACDILSGQIIDLAACAALNMAHLKLVLRQDKSFVDAGDSVQMVIAVDNLGTSPAAHATIVMDVPSGLTVEETLPPATVTYKYAYQLRWEMGRIDPGRHPTLLHVKLKVGTAVFQWAPYVNMPFSVKFCTEGDGCDPAKEKTHAYQDGMRTVAKQSVSPTIRVLAPTPGEIVREGSVTVCYDTSGDLGAAQFIDFKVDGKSVARDGEMAGMYTLQNLLPGPRRLEAVLLKKDGSAAVFATEFFVKDVVEVNTLPSNCLIVQ